MVATILNRSAKEFLPNLLVAWSAMVLAIPAAAQFPVPGDEERLVILRARSTRNPYDLVLADELAQHLFGMGRREEASLLLQGAHDMARSAAQKKSLQARIRVVARSFQGTESSKEYQAGVSALASGKAEAAEQRFSRVLAVEANHFDVLVRRGQARWLRGSVDGAFEDFSQARRVHPYEPELQLWLGLAHLWRGERRQGIVAIQEALRQGDAEARRQPFWRAALILSQWESGRSIDQLSGLRELVQSGQAPSWLLEEMLRGPVTEFSPIFTARQALERRPEGSLETDGLSGIALQIWQPERIVQRLKELDLVGARHEPPALKSTP